MTKLEQIVHPSIKKIITYCIKWHNHNNYYDWEELKKTRNIISPGTDILDNNINIVPMDSYLEIYKKWLECSDNVIYPAKSYFVAFIYSFLLALFTNKELDFYLFNNLDLPNDPFYSKNVPIKYKNELYELIPLIKFTGFYDDISNVNDMASIVVDYFFKEFKIF